MRRMGAILLFILFAGCAKPTDYSAYADGNRPMLVRIASLDARLRGLLGEAHPDSTRVPRLLDSLESALEGGSPTENDSTLMRRISSTLAKVGMVPVLQPTDSDLVPSLAWERRRGGCVPLGLMWCHALRSRGIGAKPAFLPGHLVVADGEGRLIETLRGGIHRDIFFYDSAFRLSERPYYRALRPDSNAILAAMLVQAGLIEWRSASPASAESAFAAAVKICPGLPEAEGNLGLVQQELGRESEGAEHLRTALRGDPVAGEVKWRRVAGIRDNWSK
ncbi:MAG: hypothetical protein AAB214_00580 [Fibrobacterota bacterium]